MGFWGKLGRGALKVGKIAAPIALGATGVGIPAAMAASAGLNALDKKLSGGTWKGALGAGAMGAATGAMGGVAGQAMRGINPSAGFMGKMFNPRTMGGARGLMQRMAQRRQPPPMNQPTGFVQPQPRVSQQYAGSPFFYGQQRMQTPQANQFRNLGY